MDQISFVDAEYAGKRKKTRREVILEETELVVPWKGAAQADRSNDISAFSQGKHMNRCRCCGQGEVYCRAVGR